MRALHDPVWTADGYVSSSWRPVSPVSGRIDAFQWQTPLAALPSDKDPAIESSPFEQAMLAPRVEPADNPGDVPTEPKPSAAQDNSPAAVEPAPVVTAPPPSPPSESVAAAPLFRARQDIPKGNPSSIPAVIPIIRAPDDPGIDDEPVSDEFAEQLNPAQGQAGGWRGFLSRWGG